MLREARKPGDRTVRSWTLEPIRRKTCFRRHAASLKCARFEDSDVSTFILFIHPVN
jgi:hypothetical protein